MAALSEEALERQKARRRELRQWYKEHGICERCRGETMPGKTLCPDCLRKKRQQTAKWRKAHPNAKTEWYMRMKAEGRCVICGEMARPGLTLCKKCAEREAERQQVRRIRRRVREGRA